MNTEQKKLSIALCGKPKSGKTTVAKILAEYGYVIVDDGLPLRRAIHPLFEPWGVDEADPFSQEGKARILNICGQQVTVRELLGNLGNDLEARFGDEFLAKHAILSATRYASAPCVFPSVRKSQGRSYMESGILVVEVDRDVPDSPHDFDQWAPQYVDIVLDNNGSLDELRAGVQTILEKLNSREI